jgi:dienelactone hydrolase
MSESRQEQDLNKQVNILSNIIQLEGVLNIPQHASALIVLPYNRAGDPEHIRGYLEDLANASGRAGLATLTVNLLTPENEELDRTTGFFSENVEVLHQRILDITNWLITNDETQNLPIGYFGVGVSGAAVLVAAAVRPDAVDAIVAVTPRPGLADSYLPRVIAPTLFIAAEKDTHARGLCLHAIAELTSDTTLDDVRRARERGLAHKLEVIPDAENVFENDQSLERLQQLATQWFAHYLAS